MVSVQVFQQSQLHKFHFDFLRLCGLQFCECASFTAVRKFHRRVAHLSSLRACFKFEPAAPAPVSTSPRASKRNDSNTSDPSYTYTSAPRCSIAAESFVTSHCFRYSWWYNDIRGAVLCKLCLSYLFFLTKCGIKNIIDFVIENRNKVDAPLW